MTNFLREKYVFFNRTFLLVVFLVLPVLSFAQFRSATIRIDGLTCSMCSNSVDKLIRTLDFVKDVTMDLNSNLAEVQFVQGSKVDIERLAKSVKDAGYSVGYLIASFKFESLSIQEGHSFTYEDATYRFVASGEQVLNGWVTIKFLGKLFQEKKEYLNSLPQYSSYFKEDKKNKVYYIRI